MQPSQARGGIPLRERLTGAGMASCACLSCDSSCLAAALASCVLSVTIAAAQHKGML